MILYLDTSALVKLYIDEPGRNAVTAAKSAAMKIANWGAVGDIKRGQTIREIFGGILC